MAASLSTIRDNLLDAINRVTFGQSYSIDGRTVTRANLDELLDALAKIDARIRRTSDETAGVRHAEFNDADNGIARRDRRFP